MSMRLTSGQNTIDPVTGIPVILGYVRILQDGSIRVSQTTGEPPMGLNFLPGTDQNVPGSDHPIVRETEGDDERIVEDGDTRTVEDGDIRGTEPADTRVTEANETRVTQQTHNPDIGLPYGFDEIPDTGPLV